MSPVGAPGWLLFPVYLGLFTFAASRFYQTPWWSALLKGLGHLTLYGTIVLVALMIFAGIYANGRISIDLWLGDDYSFIDGGAEVHAPGWSARQAAAASNTSGGSANG